MRYIKILFCFISLSSFAQKKLISGLVFNQKDSLPIPFATVSIKNTKRGTLADSTGKFEILIKNASEKLSFNAMGYQKKELLASDFQEKNMVFLMPADNKLSEVIIKPAENPAWAIIRKVLKNRPINDPEKFDTYEANAHTKIKILVDSVKTKTKDSLGNRSFAKSDSSVLIYEIYSELIYKKPNKSKETVLATVNNYLKMFSTVINAMPLDIHQMAFYRETYNFILDKRFFVNPINDKTFLQYDFELKDTLINSQDSTFIIAYQPLKGKNFDGFKGILKINSDGFAIESIEAEPVSSMVNFMFDIKQNYERVNGIWFPKYARTSVKNTAEITRKFAKFELRFESFYENIQINHPIDNKRFDGVQREISEKATQFTSQAFDQFRIDRLSPRESKSYDLFKKPAKINNKKDLMNSKIISVDSTIGKYLPGLMANVIAVGPVEFMTSDIFTTNAIERIRVGLGIGNNQYLKPRFRTTAYLGYGLRDNAFKYKLTADWNITKNRNNRLGIYYGRDVSSAIKTSFIGPNYYRTINQLDFLPSRLKDTLTFRPYYVKKIGAELYFKPFAWNWFRISAENQLRNYTFGNLKNKQNVFGLTEIKVDWRLAYKEFFTRSGRLESVVNRFYPIQNFQVTRGIPAFNSQFDFWKFSSSSNYQIRTKRAGVSDFNLSGEYIKGIFPVQYILGALSDLGSGVKTEGLKIGDLPTEYFEKQEPSIYKNLTFRFNYDFYNTLFRPKTKYSQPRFNVLHTAILNQYNLNANQKVMATQTKFLLSAGLEVKRIIQIPIMGFNLGLGGSLIMQYGPNASPIIKDNLRFRLILN